MFIPSCVQEIVDLLARANDTRIYHTAATEPGELDAYSEDDNPEEKLQVRAARVVFVFFCVVVFLKRMQIIASLFCGNAASVRAPTCSW